MLHAIEKQNIERLKKAADVGLGMRKWLRKFSKRKDIPEEEKESAASRIGKSSLKMWGQRMLFMRRLTPAGLATSVAAAAAIEIARKGADTISDKIDGKIKSITDFGIFVGLEGDIDGLIHLSDIAEDDDYEKALEEFKKDQNVKCANLHLECEMQICTFVMLILL